MLPRRRLLRLGSWIGLLAVSAIACQPPKEAGDTSSEGESAVKRREVPEVRAARVERRAMVRLLETTSKLESDLEIQLMPEASGVVVELNAEEGDRVRASQLLARLDDRDEALAVSDAKVAVEESKQAIELAKLAVDESDARLEASKLAFEQAQRDYARDEALHQGVESGGISALSKKDLETSRLARDNAASERVQAEIALKKAQLDVTTRKNALARAQVTLDRAQLSFEATRIVAPFDGIVAERKLRIGAMAGGTDFAFVLSDPTRLRAIFWRPQEEYSLFTGATKESGDGEGALRFTATSEAWPGEEFQGWIERVSPTLNVESSQFRVTARFATAANQPELLPGMLVRLSIETDRHADALVVPKRALRREGESRFVLKIGENGVLERVEVTEELDYADDDFVEVRPDVDGRLTEGDPIVTVGSRDLVDGDEVKVEGMNLTNGSDSMEGSTPDGDTTDGATADDATTSENDEE